MEQVYKQGIFLPPRFPPEPEDRIDTSIHELTWHLRGEFPYTGFTNPKYFVCMQAFQVCGDERKCRTPTFIGEHIPEAIEEWMRTYADILCVGMLLGRSRK